MSEVQQAYFPVPVDSLVGEAKIDFDLYVQLNTKHVLYLRKGGVFDSARLQKMREKNVRNMWILPEDEASFRNYYDRRVQSAYDLNSSVSAEERSSLIYGSLAAAAEAVFKSPANAGAYFLAQEGSKRLTEMVMKDDRAIKVLLGATALEKTVAYHGVAVAAIAIAIAKRVGLGENKDLHLLALGCLLHDGGHFADPAGTGFGKNPKSMSTDELRTFREHPLNGVRQFHDQKHFDHLVIKVIAEHEEHSDGTGFPKGINEKQMHAFSVVASSANAYEALISAEGETHPSAMKRLVVEKIGRHPLAHINALKAIVQLIA
jgi:HD-GYP domain-containing protein (c-di-GMP phosphodiesterase class II)